MKQLQLILLTITWIVVAAVPLALAQWELECNFDPIKGGAVSAYTLPDGTGDPLSNAFQWDGVPGHAPVRVDATINYTLLYYGDPVYNYPREDMWLATTLGGLVLCPGGSIADRNTDEYGQTTFSQALFAGGATDPAAGEECVVYVNGTVCPNDGLDIQFNSPDLNRDLVVDLSDVVIFATIFAAGYDYAADYYWDGTINLSDTVLMAKGLGVGCP